MIDKLRRQLRQCYVLANAMSLAGSTDLAEFWLKTARELEAALEGAK